MGSRSLQLGGSAVHQASVGLVDRARAAGGRRCSRPTPTTSCSTRSTAASTWPARRPSGGPGPSWRSRPRDDGDPLSVITDFQAAVAHVPVRRPRRGGRRRHRDRAGRAACATSRSTTPAASSTRCSPRASATAASPRAPPRRCSRRSATTRTATRSPRTSPTTPPSRPPSCPSFELVAMETPTAVNPLGAKGIGESGHDRLHARGAVRGGRRAVATSACATSTCRRAPSGCGGRCRPRRRVTRPDRGRGPGPPLRRRGGRRRRRPGGGARARSSGSSGPTAPASPPSSGCSPRCCKPTAGRARVAGYDVVDEAGAVRRAIGVALQDAAIDPLMTGRELVRLQAVLHGISKSRGRPARRRAARAGRSHRAPPTGGSAPTRAACGAGSTWRCRSSTSRRCCSSTSPPPASTPPAAPRCGRRCAGSTREGTTVFLTTQYLEEADELAGRIAIIDDGRIVREGQPAGAQGHRRRRHPRRHRRCRPRGAGRRGARAVRQPRAPPRPARSPSASTAARAALSGALRALEDAGIAVEHVELDAPSLDDVFAEATGRRLEGAGAPDDATPEAVA